MRKLIIISILFVLCIIVYLGRGFLPSDQIKKDILLQYVGTIYEMQVHLNEAIQHCENEEKSAFTSQLNLASHHARYSKQLIGESFVGNNFEVPMIMVGYHMDVINLAESAIRNEITNQDVETLRKLNDKITTLTENIGTVSELSNEYLPSSKLLDKIINGFEKTFDTTVISY